MLQSKTGMSQGGLFGILDLIKALINELRTDHGTFRSCLNETYTAVKEMHDDHATFKTAVDNQKTAMKNMALSSGGIAIATTKTKVKTANTITYLINGEFKSKAAADPCWDLTGFDCSNGKYNKCLLYLDSSGNASIGAGTQADSAADVVLPSIPSDKAVVGMVQVHPTGTGDFTGGTTDLDDGTVVPNATYYNLAFHPDQIGDAPATLSASKPSTDPPATISASAVTYDV